jgi:hypothetical protein
MSSMDFHAVGSPNVEVKADGVSRDQMKKSFKRSWTASVMAASADTDGLPPDDRH